MPLMRVSPLMELNFTDIGILTIVALNHKEEFMLGEVLRLVLDWHFVLPKVLISRIQIWL